MVSTRSQGQPLQTPLPDRGRSRSPSREGNRSRSNSTPGRFVDDARQQNASQEENDLNNENVSPNVSQEQQNVGQSQSQSQNEDDNSNSYASAQTSPERNHQRPANFDPRFAFYRPGANGFQRETNQDPNWTYYNPSHNVRAAAPRENSDLQPRIVPLRPMDVAKDWFLDYVSPQSIKFFNKAIEKLPGDKFDGKGLYAWLNIVHDKAITYAWLPILTINGKILTHQYAEISMSEVRAHAQIIQDESRRRAQNSEMLITCLKASINREVYTRVNLLYDKYTIVRQSDGLSILDGICYLKTIIDCYHSNTRSTGCEIRKKLAKLPHYMIHEARGDVVKLCRYAREQLNKLHAAGLDTQDLLMNLIEALRKAPDPDFTRWLETRFDLWSTRQLEWNDDGTDLMEQAEEYYQELKERGTWGRKKKFNTVYAYAAHESDDDDDKSIDSNTSHTSAKPELDIDNFLEALTARFQKKKSPTARKANLDPKYKWKLIPPKDGEAVTKKVSINDVRKLYHWCEHHKLWTLHDPLSCKRLPPGSGRPSRDRYSHDKRAEFKKRKKEYLEAKAALQAFSFDYSDEDHTDSDNDDNSSANQSDDDSSNCS